MGQLHCLSSAEAPFSTTWLWSKNDGKMASIWSWGSETSLLARRRLREWGTAGGNLINHIPSFCSLKHWFSWEQVAEIPLGMEECTPPSSDGGPCSGSGVDWETMTCQGWLGQWDTGIHIYTNGRTGAVLWLCIHCERVLQLGGKHQGALHSAHSLRWFSRMWTGRISWRSASAGLGLISKAAAEKSCCQFMARKTFYAWNGFEDKEKPFTGKTRISFVKLKYIV